MDLFKDQLFEINYPELVAMLQGNFDHVIASIQYEATGNMVGIPGLCGEYILPRIVLNFCDETTTTLTLFARRQLNRLESKQAHHYSNFTGLDRRQKVL